MTTWHADFLPLQRAPRNRTRVLLVARIGGRRQCVTARFDPDDRKWLTDGGLPIREASVEGFYHLPKLEAV